ncbi:MAG: hypothetical protein HN348_22410, partial [Proteobacteria bacterium]|nr:hypothetical protein [Pseudomonadota bacterium]
VESTAHVWHPDDDNDTYGSMNISLAVTACKAPNGYVSDSTDCDDDVFEINPVAQEICDNGVDNDCSGTSDDNDDNLVKSSRTEWYLDDDNDNYGDKDQTKYRCAQPNGYVENNDDCDDNDDEVNPDATEICDTIDNNCDEQVNEDLGQTSYYQDFDGDTYGDPNSSTVWCEEPDGYVSNDTDCDDNNQDIYPNAADTQGDGVDSNCDGKGGPDYDDDGDGLTWQQEQNRGSLDSKTDTDDDGVLDNDELKADTDDDNIMNAADDDDDGDGIPTAVEGTDDPDDDGLPNYLDTDSDGDGSLDNDEGTGDLDNDGIPNYLDTGKRPDDDTSDAPPDPPTKYGIGCHTGPTPAGTMALMLALAALRRREHI